jgi:membrane protease subunit (stomatin/prohibitin family)
MSLWSRLGHEIVDIIELPDQPAGTLVERFQRYEDQIKYGAQLIVREGQVAVFVRARRTLVVWTDTWVSRKD